MDRKTILLPAIVETVATRTDGTLKIVIGTNELSPDTMAALFGLMRKACYVAVKPEGFGQEEIEQIEAARADLGDDTRKTKSQRLRAVLYRLWEQDPQGFDGFDAYYLSRMEKIIEHYRAKLP